MRRIELWLNSIINEDGHNMSIGSLKTLEMIRQEVNLLWGDKGKPVEEEITKEDLPVMIGTLNRRQGIIGFKPAEIGHPVFEFKDRYIIYLGSNDGKTVLPVTYYKENLLEAIDFIKK